MSLFIVSSISRVLRARFGKKDDDDECDKKDEDGEKKTKHSIDGILGDKGQRPLHFSLFANRCEETWCIITLTEDVFEVWIRS